MEDKINELVNKNKWNKRFALIGVLLSLILSCGLIYHGMCIYDSKDSVLDNTTTTKYVPIKQICAKQHADTTTCCKVLYGVESVPEVVTENNYNNATNVLLCISALIFIILALWGTFTFLVKVLKSEQEINSKLFELYKDIYKETKMWELTKQKNEYENEKFKSLKPQEKSFKEIELDLKIKEFQEIEQKKILLKKNESDSNLIMYYTSNTNELRKDSPTSKENNQPK